MPARRRARVPPEGPGARLGWSDSRIKVALDRLASHFGRGFLATDPVGLVHRFVDPDDREVAGLLAASLSYGRVESIRGSVARLLDILGPGPARFADRFDPVGDIRRLEGFVHRFTTGGDLAWLLWLIRQARSQSGSLKAFFLRGDPDPRASTYEDAMNAFGQRLFALDPGPFAIGDRGTRSKGVRWLLPLPSGGSTCKRHCLYLRWMVRPEDGVDLGAWDGMSPSRLVVPLDVHLQRIASALGWSARRSPCWSMAIEVTASLRRLDPADPTRYDFALCRLGILGAVSRSGDGAAVSQVRRVLEDVEGGPPRRRTG